MYNVELDMIKHIMYTARIKTQQTMKKQNKKQTKTKNGWAPTVTMV